MFKRSLLIVAIALSFSLSHAASASVPAGNSASEQSLPLTIDDILDNAQTIQTEMLNQNRMGGPAFGLPLHARSFLKD